MAATKQLIVAWFIADIVLALLPPLYWACSGVTPVVLGLPLSVAYFFGVGIFATASIVVAYSLERGDGRTG